MSLNPSQMGLITEYKCQLFLIEQGWNVLIPIGNYLKYDLVIEKNNRFYRIQCKHATEQETGFIVKTRYDIREQGRVKKVKYTTDDVDYFMTEFKDRFYLFPVFGTLETRFWTVPSTNKNSKIAKEYLAEDILQTM